MILSLMLFIVFIMILLMVSVFIVGRNKLVETYKTTGNSNNCPVLTNALNDNETKDVLMRKLRTVSNDGSNFRAFDSNKRFDSNKDYCYINTLSSDSTKTNFVPCQKGNSVYNYDMIQSVNLGEVLEPHHTVPTQVCIMEIDKAKVLEEDVEQLNKMISRHDNKSLIQNVDECKKRVENEIRKYGILQSNNNELETDFKDLQNEYQNATAEIEKMKSEIFALKAQKDALNGIVVLQDLKEMKQVSLNTKSDQKTVSVPQSFTVNMAYLPENVTIQLIKLNGSFMVFSKDTPGYPSLDKYDVFNVVKCKII